MKNNNGIKTVVAVGIGAALFFVLGRTVRLLRPDGGGETAEALDIDEEFGLVVRRPDGAVKTVRSGEVSVRGLYGYTE